MNSAGSMLYTFSIINLFLVAASICIMVLVIYALILSIKALKIYIEKNSRQ
ncbi:hypothetical protein Ana3638_02180 [Anaerocolumna sedimenticola]|uniref:Oxaloacetate decarboxylase n=1 Tax=Anaerocolumna sedimenticola TaxID=2696063 RepID=A0A6P1TH48_9FIRM|nr:hypothetical protein [Anaerocolumna sedimenticola]QHQ59753.1 hypothetical protein Ana3638_02180 [Anaerocolumna sedimenticola]